MSIILYARVSTESQADRELSIPAQLRLMRDYAAGRSWSIAGVYQDVCSGTSLKGRTGLVEAVRHARRDPTINGLLVHKIDRLSRNMFTYLAIKGQLATHGANILSVVEHFEASPMGEFIEHIMAAQAEFYSANLSSEVKRGLEERLLQGRWNGNPPVGYLNAHDRVILDPARARFMQQAFTLWSTGMITCTALAERLHADGFVGVTGQKVRASRLCELLKNRFYVGDMVVKGKVYAGIHPPLVPRELFERCQAVFHQKAPGRGQPHRNLSFLLSKKLRCPRCGRHLVGEEHRKASEKRYRYYRCHGCGFTIESGRVEQDVLDALNQFKLTECLGPKLRRAIQGARRRAEGAQRERVYQLREERRMLDKRLRDLARAFALTDLPDLTRYEMESRAIHETIRTTEWLLSCCTQERERGNDGDLVRALRALPTMKNCSDPVERRRTLDALIADVDLTMNGPKLALTARCRELLDDQEAVRTPPIP